MLGINVTDIGLATTPTVEMAVTGMKAGGGIILTASHNPAQWNALKLLNEAGEFLSDSDGRAVLALAESEDFDYVSYDLLGTSHRRNRLDGKAYRICYCNATG